ncbi:MAG: VCBS repeat-containing protein [Planctomycetes bacterium]|nr:VCBS repeat-containing protein [Planctomycetota bacterium]
MPARPFASVLPALLLVVPLHAAGETPRFPIVRVLDPGYSAREVHLVDLTSDGVLDVLVVNQSSSLGYGVVVTAVGRGDGSFEDGVSHAAGDASAHLAAADFDADGRLDAVVANQGEVDLSLLLGLGDGTFAPAQSIAGGAKGWDVAAGDVDGDGVVDVVAARRPIDRITVHLGQGDGSFSAGFTRLTQTDPEQLALADLDLDGDLDAVTSHILPDGLSVMLGAGNGAFLQAVPVPTQGQGVDAFVLDDLDLDGVPDACVAFPYESAIDADVQFARGLGDGTFGPFTGFETGSRPLDLAVGDVDRDGLPDVVAAQIVDSEVAVLRNLGGGAFAVADVAHPVGSASRLDLGDVDGDGVLDIVAGFSAKIVVVRGSADGTFADPLHSPLTAGSVLRELSVGDLDEDGLLDAIVFSEASPSGELLAFAGEGGGAFDATPLSSTPVGNPSVADLAVADLDADGHLDVFALGAPTFGFSTFLGAGDGTLAAQSSRSLASKPFWVTVDDLDLDGVVDAAFVSPNADVLFVSLGVGDGSFAVPLEFPSPGSPRGVAAGDLDLDGVPDLAVAQFVGGVARLFGGLGDGTFVERQALLTGLSHVEDVALGDLDGDGLPDLAALGSFQETRVALGLGDGTLGAATSVGATDAEAFEILDVTGDGRPDLVGSGNLTFDVWVTDGQGGLDLERYGSGRFGADPAVFADLDGDGDVDVLVKSDGVVEHGLLAHLQQQPSVWCGLGHALAGAHGAPSLVATGGLLGGDVLGLELSGAAPSATTWLVIGFSELSAPFKGGVLVPDPTPPALVVALATDAAGRLVLALPWPTGVPSGLEILFQDWIVDAGAPKGFAATNAVLGTTP